MKKILTLATMTALVVAAANRTNAVELLISGDFETPGGAVGEIPFWELQEFLTDSSAGVDSAGLNIGDDSTLWVKGFAGGGPLRAAQGNFNEDGLPGGLVDGRDFLMWQRGESPNVLGAGDLSVWKANYGSSASPGLANARLRQTVPAVAGETYSFYGSAEFEEYYSGIKTTLDDASPFGQIASPTVTQFKMEFLNSSGQVIGTPSVVDLRTVVTFPDFPVTTNPLVAVAPAGTANVRVVAEALNMAWNGASTQETPGNNQSAFFNDFVLTRAADAGTNLLQNGDLNLSIPNALDFWDRSISPEGCCGATEANPYGQLLRTPQEPWANHTPGGNRGVWLSPFWGGSTNFVSDPVDASMSQTVGAVEGGTYTFSGWTKFEQNYSGGVDTISAAAPAHALFQGQPSPTVTEIRLDFLDNGGSVISSSVIDVKEERQAACGGNANSTTCGPGGNGWLQHTLQAVAPIGTVQARLTGQMIDGVFNIDPQQSAFFDDFSLEGPAPPSLANVSVPEPSSLVVLGLGTLLLGLGRKRK